jgi:hypothetical protein
MEFEKLESQNDYDVEKGELVKGNSQEMKQSVLLLLSPPQLLLLINNNPSSLAHLYLHHWYYLHPALLVDPF